MVFEHIPYAQISNLMENKLSNGTQHYLMIIIEKWKNVLDKGEYVCALFMDLSKHLIQLIMIYYW